MQTELTEMHQAYALARAANILAWGGIVAFPTDTVYALGASVFNENAVSQISDIKDRSGEKTLPVLIGNFEQLALITGRLNKSCQALTERFWPGPLTIVVQRHHAIPDAVTPLPTVGIRMPDFLITLELLKLTGPLAVTSANLAGMSSSSTARGVLAQLNGKIPLILDGGVTPGGMPSTLLDCTHEQPVILREGPISYKQIMAVIG